MKIFYVIGYPGAGKSALMHTVFKDTKSFLNTDPFAHTWHFATADSIPIKLAERWVTPEWHLDGMATLTQLAAHVGQHPVFEPLRVPSVSVTNEITIS
jgi:hypothetical protein